MNVADWMSRDVESVDPKELLCTARDRMMARRCRHLPVVDSGENLIGILTERDLREHSSQLSHTRVHAAMTTELVTVSGDTSIQRAAVLMVEHQIGALPVVARDGRLIGVITRTDLLRGLVRMLCPVNVEVPQGHGKEAGA